MDPYNVSQPDEGYSEDPLNPSTAVVFPNKSRENVSAALAELQSNPNIPAWLSAPLAALSVQDRTRKETSFHNLPA
jgi:F-box and WD-40 domain protein 1/11